MKFKKDFFTLKEYLNFSVYTHKNKINYKKILTNEYNNIKRISVITATTASIFSCGLPIGIKFLIDSSSLSSEANNLYYTKSPSTSTNEGDIEKNLIINEELAVLDEEASRKFIFGLISAIPGGVAVIAVISILTSTSVKLVPAKSASDVNSIMSPTL